MTRIAYDDFDIGETIGFGTVGTIYRVTDRATGDIYALKLLSPAVGSDPLVVARFRREMMVLSKLDHPNIVAYFGDGDRDGQLFYVMELIEGGNLKEMLKNSGPFSWKEAAECGRQIASALQHAHNHGIIHRDLKPGNVFITLKGIIKLGDFGIARDLRETELTEVGLTVGTYAYMAPELVRGNREITGQVDLYALGCVLYEMLTGQPPYLGDNFAEIFEQHLHSDPPHVRNLVPNCPESLDKLILALLAKSPDDRPFNARTVQGILGELCMTPNQDQPTANPQDRAALDVRPIQLSLVERICATPESHEVDWRTVALLGFGVAVLVSAALVLKSM
ncbi:MAG: serine/threonine-protein kinase [Pirellulaceae bacterium]|nr:serine/threonine-protein kinase [Pirellulaceae bacterium]